jgi:cytochrome c peroxidase
MRSVKFPTAALLGSTALGAALSLAVGMSIIATAEEHVPTQERAEVGELPVPARGATSYMPVIEQDFNEVFERMSAQKEEVMKRAQALLDERYDLADQPVDGVTMSGGKPVQGGVRVKLSEDVTWEELAEMTPSKIREQGLWPKGFLPLPHPFHEEGGMVFPEHHIKEIREQEGRDLERFDMDFDIPAHFLPEFPPPIFLTTRPDLGDVAQGEVVTSQNFYVNRRGKMTP